MAILNLIDCLPQPEDGSPKRLLPKQQEFFDSVLNPKGPNYILYAGGVGSAKTTIGCLTTLALACMYPGDYLVCRQFLPELKLTTLKTFLQLCPKDLIVEHRVADGIVRIRSTGGKTSDVIFRGLDEPDKHRSLNLNAVYIDESSQVSSEAFLLLQSRLRGRYVRKIYMTTNPAGHDWQYNLFVKQDTLSAEAKRMFKLIKAPSTENIFLPDGYVQAMLLSYSKERIEREVMASFDAFQGQIYNEFNRSIHVIKPFRIPDEWTRFVGIDHGYTNPMAAIWIACDYDGVLYAYREMFQPGWTIKELVKGNTTLNEPGLIQRNRNDKLEGLWIDPSTKADRGKESDYTTYLEHMPKEWSLMPANNSVQTGIDRVKEYLKIDPKTGKPRMYFFETCENLIDEMVKYKWKELTSGVSNTQNPKEEPVKKDDHAVDALRYAVMSRPDEPKVADMQAKKRQQSTLEASLMRELHEIRTRGSSKDMFGDFEYGKDNNWEDY